ncbi:hypothetical protein E2562_006923 [Oryza meyeriana var. granulata]|uniref:Uncharacterized protein n=1 Tax=Oryza meyeriana var. granulata TaxID=110450 RepID=A0A6G1BJX1_9ORYZ|nr:hypothetical protein E2562_006923 [Oryza meyeriana var. granulata]
MAARDSNAIGCSSLCLPTKAVVTRDFPLPSSSDWRGHDRSPPPRQSMWFCAYPAFVGALLNQKHDTNDHA